ncbi:MAG TPA: hypothetical protein PKH24_06675 [Sedimentisphaerales bacterium]|jgi:hypothetical protein|nr:hypothetical protein [Sedimentisphaerales bacterium]HNU28406.1 hypothetical protein [Sedimentisphaerales bacterium]
MDWFSMVSLVIAGLSAAFAAGAWLAAHKSLTYQALADVMRDYAEDNIAEDVSTLWVFFRKCRGNNDSLMKEFGKLLDDSEHSDVTVARRRVSHFYQRVGALYAGKVLPGKVLYRHWSRDDLSIIPKVIIPLERVLYERLQGRGLTAQCKILEDLYEDSAKWWKEIVV